MDARSNMFYITKKVSSLINMTVSIMGTDGEVITSMDSFRVGIINDVALQLISNHVIYYQVNEDNYAKGAEKGAVAILQIDGKIFGAVEICGDPQTAMGYIKIVKAMCEKMIQEAIGGNNYTAVTKRRNQFIRNWLVNGITDKLDFAIESIAFGIDRFSDKRCIIVRADIALTDPNYKNKKLVEAFHQIINEICCSVGTFPQDLILTSYFKSCIIFQHESKEKCIELGEMLKQRIEGELGLPVYIGIGKSSVSDDEMPVSLYSAERACIISSVKSMHPVSVYEDVDMELLLQSVPLSARRDYLSSVFRGYTEAEIKDVIGFLFSMYSFNGSIAKVAEDMYLHKNTVQNRIFAIKKRTGYDVRKTNEALPLYTAMLIYLFMQEKEAFSD